MVQDKPRFSAVRSCPCPFVSPQISVTAYSHFIIYLVAYNKMTIDINDNAIIMFASKLLGGGALKDNYVSNSDISFLIKKLDNHIHRKIHELYNRKEFQECSIMNMWVADYLYDMEQLGKVVYQKDIEAEFSINRATASKMLSLMEKKKLIKRTNDTCDNRLKQIELELRGLELQHLCCYIRTEIEKNLTSHLSGEEISLFKTLCLRMIEHI